MGDQSPEWKPNNRPVSTIALNFSAALDDIFNLGPTGDLAINVEQKKTDVKVHEQQLEDLDARLRQAEEQLKTLQSKHKRMQSENILSSRGRGRGHQTNNSNSDSDEQTFSDGQSSPTSDAAGRR